MCRYLFHAAQRAGSAGYTPSHENHSHIEGNGPPVTSRSHIAAQAYGGRRITPQRALVAHVAATRPGAFTVEELAEAVRAQEPAAGALATVYRAVAAMEESGFIERVGARDGGALYLRCGHDGGHHHHVVCDGCGRVAHAECPVGPTVEASAAEGFVVTRHEITLYGLCPECAARGTGE